MGWNGSGGGSTPQKPKVTAKKPSPMRGVIAGVLVCVLAIGAYFAFFAGSEKPETEAAAKERGRIKEVTPARAPTNKVEEVKAKPKGPRPKPACVKPDEHGVERWPSGARYVPDYGFRTNSINPYAGQKRIFKHGSEIHIATLLTLKPGNMIIGGFQYGKNFDENFKKALEEEIEFKEDDTEEERQLKEDVIQVKKELKEAMARGEKPSDIMQKAREELVEAFQYKHNLEQQLMAIRKDKNMTEQDIIDGYEAANKMLEEKGIPGFSTGVMKKRFERLKQKELKQKGLSK